MVSLAEEASKITVPADVPLKNRKDFKIIGTQLGMLKIKISLPAKEFLVWIFTVKEWCLP